MTDELTGLRATVDALEEVTRTLRRRILLLARVLPLEYLPYLEGDLEDLEKGLPAVSILDGWVETTALTPSDVKTELSLLWRRLSPEGDE